MKKSSFMALVLGTISGVLFALGMCMALLPEWNAFTGGIILGCVGLGLGYLTWILWRIMEHKPPIRINGKTVLLVLYIVLSALVFGGGMCLCLVLENILVGTLIGLVGILLLLGLIPMTKGLK